METLAYLALIALATISCNRGSCESPRVTTTFYHSHFRPTLAVVPDEQFAIAAVIFAALIAVNIVKPKMGYRLVTIFSFFGVLCILLAIGTLLSAGRTGVENYMSSLG